VLDDAVVSDWCGRSLGTCVARVLFRSGHLAQVIGAELADGRSVVIKVRPFEPRVAGCAAVQAHLAATGFPCPVPLAGPAVHLDGARLWESAAGYGRPLTEIAALFDTVYVSFYKGIGALAGCCVAGPADILAEVREWRQRMGGTLFGLWPNAASALSCLRRRLPLMPGYLCHAREIAAALRGVAGVRVVPDPPQVPMMHLLLDTTQDGFAAAARQLAAEQRIWTWPKAMTTADPGIQRVELSVGDATCALQPDQVRDIIAALVRQ
jgi:threonine aldolase